MDPVTPALLPHLDHEIPSEGLPIGDAARAVGLSVETLRYYEREGLLIDPAPRRGNGHRRYHRPDLEWIAGLVMLRETGMPIAGLREIAEISRIPGTEEQRLAVFERHRVGVVSQLERMRRHLAAIDAKIAAYRAYVAEGDSHD